MTDPSREEPLSIPEMKLLRQMEREGTPIPEELRRRERLRVQPPPELARVDDERAEQALRDRAARAQALVQQ